MKILVFSPLELPYTVGARYTGLERLSVQFAERWSKTDDVTLLAHKDTNVPDGVKLIPCEGYEQGRTIHAEQRAYQRYQKVFRDFDVIWDISHLHLIARFMPNMPTVNIFHANPEYAAKAKYEKAPYNLVSWSKWGVREIRRWYGKDARYQETIMVDPSVYTPVWNRGNRLLTIGRMSEEKGNKIAAQLCKFLKLPLDIAGGRGSELEHGQELTEYERAIMELCDGEEIRYLGEVSDEEKIRLMQSCRGLLYSTSHVEITSHKVQEAMFCGCPVIVPNLGGMPEIVTHGVNGYLCNTEQDYINALSNIDKLNPREIHGEFIKKYLPDVVSKGYLDLMKEVANGLRWK